MNIFKKLAYRTYQGIMKMMIPLMPYHEPKILSSIQEVSLVLSEDNIKNVILITDAGITKLGLYNNLIKNLKDCNINCVIYDKTVANPTISNVEDALKMYKANNCQAIIAFGGGSPIDCAKALGARIARPNKSVQKMKGLLKIRKTLPLLIAIPTTAGTGSETTVASVITDDTTHHKYAINDFSLIPKYAVLDATLTVGLPKNITASTGLDALTHAIEAYIGKSTTKKTRMLSLEAIKTILDNIKVAYDEPTNLVARNNMLNASYKAGVAFTISYVGYVHAIAHSLGGQYNLAHGLTNAIILPYVLEFYGKSIYKKAKKICIYCNLAQKKDQDESCFKKLLATIREYNRYLGIPGNISEIKTNDIPALVDKSIKEANPLYPVPKIANKQQLTRLYLKIKG